MLKIYVTKLSECPFYSEENETCAAMIGMSHEVLCEEIIDTHQCPLLNGKKIVVEWNPDYK